MPPVVHTKASRVCPVRIRPSLYRQVRRWWVVAGLCGLTTACAARTPQTAAPERFRLALSPASFHAALSLRQQVRVERDGRTASFDAVFDVDSSEMTLVGLALGQRLFTLRYDGTALTESRSKFLPAEIHGADVLSDLQLALWPADAIRAALPPGWTLMDTDALRVLRDSVNDVTRVTYDGSPRWNGTITLRSVSYGYALVIVSTADAP
jgi:hypothetical protein